MSDEKPSFEVRERRRSRKQADSDAAGAATDGPADASATASPSSPPADPVVEKTHTATEQTGSVQSSGGAASETPSSEEETTSGFGTAADEGGAAPAGDDEGGDFQMPEISLAGLLQFTVGSLGQLAWQHLGLVASPSTGKVQANLPEARFAIDAFSALAPVMSSRLDDSSRRDMQNLLANLRLNYVEQSKRQRAPSSDSSGTSDSPEDKGSGS